MNRSHFFAAFLALALSLAGASSSYASGVLWTGSGPATARAEALLKALRSAGDHGLDPTWYNLSEVEKAMATGADPSAAEAMLSAAFAAYASDVSTGRVRANRVDKEIDIIQRKVDKAELLEAAASAPDFAAYLASLPPKGDYPALQKALATWGDAPARRCRPWQHRSSAWWRPTRRRAMAAPGNCRYRLCARRFRHSARNHARSRARMEPFRRSHIPHTGQNLPLDAPWRALT